MARLRMKNDAGMDVHHPRTALTSRTRSSTSTYSSSVVVLGVSVSSLLLMQFVVFLQVWNHHVELHEVILSILHQQNKSAVTTDVDSRQGSQKMSIDTSTMIHQPPSVVQLQTPGIQGNVVGTNSNFVVNYGDMIYTNNHWNGSPVVIEEYHLIFFTTAKNACTIWFQLLRRMMHIKKWNEVDNSDKLLPWNPEYNGLKYLYDYNISYVNEIMTSPRWTRAIIVRDPKERFLSAYIDKVLRNEKYVLNKCCPTTGSCVEPAKSNITTFLHEIAYFCHNPHWIPQNLQMTPQQWSYVNFVGHMDTIQGDSERLLKRLGVWELYGSSGWGSNRRERIFHGEAGDNTGRMHATNAKRHLRSYISPELEIELNEYFANDYNHSIMKLPNMKLF
jgi:hypothetical protein